MKKVAVGVDIGGTNTVIGIVDHEGNILTETCFPTNSFPKFEEYAAKVSREIVDLAKEYSLVGIGIGAPAANSLNGTIEDSANLPWKGIVPVCEIMKRHFNDVSIVVGNDADAAAMGEMVYGGAKGVKDFVVVTLGTGLGSGLIANGKLISGFDSYAGELGHIIVERPGRKCGCGRAGCLETYVSATGIRRTVYELLESGSAESVLQGVAFEDLNGEMITKAALNGDPIAKQAYEFTGMMLGRSLADMVALIGSGAIFLFGGLTKAGELIFESTRRHFEENLLAHYRGRVKIVPSALQDKNAAILGAAALVWG